MRVAKRIGMIGAAVLLFAPVYVRADSVADVIPADAKAVLLVNDLEKFTSSLDKFALAAHAPKPQTDLAQVTQVLGGLGSSWKLDRGEDAMREAYLVKHYAAYMVLKVCDNAVQVLGGHGYIRDHPVELWLRNSRGFAAFEGMAIA